MITLQPIPPDEIAHLVNRGGYVLSPRPDRAHSDPSRTLPTRVIDVECEDDLMRVRLTDARIPFVIAEAHVDADGGRISFKDSRFGDIVYHLQPA